MKLHFRPFINDVWRSRPTADGTIYEIRKHRAGNRTTLWWDVFELANEDADGVKLFGGVSRLRDARRELAFHLENQR